MLCVHSAILRPAIVMIASAPDDQSMANQHAIETTLSLLPLIALIGCILFWVTWIARLF
jgi:hypothetical protein